MEKCVRNIFFIRKSLFLLGKVIKESFKKIIKGKWINFSRSYN